MKRRELMLLLVGAITAAQTLSAQQKVMPVIGFLGGEAAGAGAANITAFRQGTASLQAAPGQQDRRRAGGSQRGLAGDGLLRVLLGRPDVRHDGITRGDLVLPDTVPWVTHHPARARRLHSPATPCNHHLDSGDSGCPRNYRCRSMVQSDR